MSKEFNSFYIVEDESAVARRLDEAARAALDHCVNWMRDNGQSFIELKLNSKLVLTGEFEDSYARAYATVEAISEDD